MKSFFLLSLLSFSSVTFADTVTKTDTSVNAPQVSIPDLCVSSLKSLPGKNNEEALVAACKNATMLPSCVSTKGVPIFQIDHQSSTPEARKILVFALIHGDEFPSGSVARSWLERLTKIPTRNHWRIIPVLNPDGVKNKTRYNANGVDLNRNFPTKDWDGQALKYWEQKTKKDKRRYPGPSAASEVETRCAMAEIDDYKPDLILSIHTPYGVLDFDGPKIEIPKFPHIPWKSLGNYPGSLGRFMWVDRSKPILTIELQEKGVTEQLTKYDQLQDISGDIAIRSEKVIQKQQKEKQPKP
jgi:hypothetical protein